MNSLSISLKHFEDSSIELFVILNYRGFKGTGSCYLDSLDFSKRAQRFALFPLPIDGSVCIEGGYFNENMIGLKQTHLHVSARPTDVLGNLALNVKLATPVDLGVTNYEATLSCVIPMTYEKLKELAEAMAALANCHGDEYSIEL